MRSVRVLVKQLPTQDHPVTLSPIEAHHLIRVLRLKKDDLVEVIDGQGSGVIAKISSVRPDEDGVIVQYVEPLRVTASAHVAQHSLTLVASVLKGDSFPWLIEKSVEIGVSELIPILTEYTVVQIDKKGPEKFLTKWQTIADQTLKQCERLTSMKVHFPISFESAVMQCSREKNLISRERLSNQNNEQQDLYSLLQSGRWSPGIESNSIFFWVGPEGGWSPKEIKTFQTQTEVFIPVQLGSTVLRSETAAIVGSSILTSHFRLLS